MWSSDSWDVIQCSRLLEVKSVSEFIRSAGNLHGKKIIIAFQNLSD